MGTIVNLNRYRKAKQAAERERRANERRLRFGMPKAERMKHTAEQSLDKRRHESHRFEGEAGTD